MQTLSVLIFLSLLTSCGKQVKPSGPDPILIEAPAEASPEERAPLEANENNKENNKENEKEKVSEKVEEAPKWIKPEIQSISVYSESNNRELKAMGSEKILNDYFYNNFKGQYKNHVFAMGILNTEGVWFYKAETIKGRYLIKLKLNHSQNIKRMTLVFSDYAESNPASPKILVEKEVLDQEFIEFEVDLSELSKSGKKSAVLKVEVKDFTTKNQIKTGQERKIDDRKNQFFYGEHRKTLMQKGYRLHIEGDQGKRISFYIQAGKDLESALSENDLSFTKDSNGLLDTFQGQPNYSTEVDINNYSDKISFWKLINTPTQSLNYRPEAGQEILIRSVNMRELRKSASKRVSKKVATNGHRTNTPPVKDVYAWYVKGAQVIESHPYVKKRKRKSKYQRENPQHMNKMIGAVERLMKCHYYEYYSEYKVLAAKPINLESLLSKGQGEMIGEKYILDKHGEINLNYKVNSSQLKVGTKDKDCGRRAIRKFRMKNKYFPHKHKIILELEAQLRL